MVDVVEDPVFGLNMLLEPAQALNTQGVMGLDIVEVDDILSEGVQEFVVEIDGVLG